MARHENSFAAFVQELTGKDLASDRWTYSGRAVGFDALMAALGIALVISMFVFGERTVGSPLFLGLVVTIVLVGRVEAASIRYRKALPGTFLLSNMAINEIPLAIAIAMLGRSEAAICILVTAVAALDSSSWAGVYSVWCRMLLVNSLVAAACQWGSEQQVPLLLVAIVAYLAMLLLDAVMFRAEDRLLFGIVTPWGKMIEPVPSSLCILILCAGVAFASYHPSMPLLLVPFACILWYLRRQAFLLAEVERRANTDSLTGLLTRERFAEMAIHTLATARRMERSCAVLMCDLDHFKRVNDTLGHGAGDDVLRSAARALQSAAGRASDIAGRYGGEEFVLLVPLAADERPEAVAEKVRAEVERDLDAFDVTVSIGIAELPEIGAVPSDPLDGAPAPTEVIVQNAHLLDLMIERADAALYAAKRGGRNQWQLWTSPDPDTGLLSAA